MKGDGNDLLIGKVQLFRHEWCLIIDKLGRVGACTLHGRVEKLQYFRRYWPGGWLKEMVASSRKKESLKPFYRE